MHTDIVICSPARGAIGSLGCTLKDPSTSTLGAHAIATAYAEFAAGLSRMAIAGGAENMERAPYLLPAMRFGARMGNQEAVDALLLDGLHDAFAADESARPDTTAETLARLKPAFRPDGAILVTKVAHALQRTGENKAAVSLCIGGGQDIALCLERA